MKRILIYISILTQSLILAQQKKDSIDTEVINVIRSYTPQVQDAYKLNINPDSILVIEKKIKVKYEIESVPVASTFQPEKGQMTPYQFSNHNEKNTNSYLSLGFGNYTHIQTNAFLTYPITDKLKTALLVKHFSSQGNKKENDTLKPYYHTSANILMDYQNLSSLWKMDLGYYSAIHFLNYNPETHPINTPPNTYEQKRNQNIFNFDITGNFKDLAIKDLAIKFKNFSDAYHNNENLLKINTNFSFPLGELNMNSGLRANLVSGNIYEKNISNTEQKSYKNLDLGIIPSFDYVNENLDVKIGAKIIYQNADTLYQPLQIFPDIQANLNLIYEKLSVYASLNGDILQNSYIELSQKNYYLAPPKMLPQLMPFELYGGIKGAFSSAFSYNIKMGYRKLNNHPFFTPATSFDYLPYQIIYDDLNQSFFGTELKVGIGKKLDFDFNFTYFQNKSVNLPKAYFMPDYILKSLILFHPSEKLNINLSLFNYGNRPYPNDGNLSPFTDLNLEIRYQINKKFTTFIEGHNLLNQKYQIYYAYPVEKMQISGGIFYKFDLLNKNY